LVGGLYRKLLDDPAGADNELWKMYKEGKINVLGLIERDMNAGGETGMGRAKRLLEQLSSLIPFTQKDVVDAFTSKLRELGIEDVTVTDCDVGYEGDVVVEFTDSEGDSVTVCFGSDLQEGPYAMVVSEGDEQVIIDLSPLKPPIISTQTGTYIDLKNLDWINRSTIKTLLQAGEVGVEESVDLNKVDALDEVVYRKVVRQGKVVRIPVVKKREGHHLTPAQRRALALARRKAHSPEAERKRKRSLMLRRRLKLDISA